MMDRTLDFDIGPDELEIFVEDVNELIHTMENGILSLEEVASAETLNAIFRAAHTLKAVAGTVGHEAMAELTHTVETLFDQLRQTGSAPDQAVIDELLVTVDILRALRDEVVSREPSGVDVAAALQRIRVLAAQEEEQRTDQPKPDFERRLTPEQVTQTRSLLDERTPVLEVEALVSQEAFAPAARLLQATLAASEIGQIIVQQPTQEALLQNQNPGSLWLVLATDASHEEIVAHLTSITDIAECHVKPFALTTPQAEPDTTSNDKTKDTTAHQDADGVRATVDTSTTVRISVERLDALMNLVGELVTDRNRLVQVEENLRAQHGRNGLAGGLSEMTAHFGRVVDQLQEEVMRARMLPIGQLFSKLPRLVRDVARAANKEINLVIEGEATELDRSVIESIGDPLIHLLRNAADHGIESPQARVSAGKPSAGTIRLSAAHSEGQIVITVEDDGRGIDPERVRRAAVARNLLTAEEAAQLDEHEVISLIFRPNLSTAEKVTDVSGRGVGMDVVRTNVERLGGMVTVQSQVGHGTTFRVTLPLTLAIMQSMLVALGQDVFAVPLTAIIDSLYLDDVTVSTIKKSPVIQWRGSVLPLLELRQHFDDARLPSFSKNGAKRAIVTVSWGKMRLGLVVDRIIGQQEIVVKSLSRITGNIDGISGCAILGDGRIALILDVPGLINAALQARRERTQQVKEIV